MLRHRIVMACIAAAAVLFQAAGFASQAWAQERRVALVVGANEYRHVTPLATAVNDARAVARRLGELGFEVVGPVLDPTRDQFIAALDRFEALLAGANLGLFFYAGHGVEVGGRNLLLPVDAPAATSERQLRANAIDAQEIVSGMLARTARAVVILDACRDNPLPRDPARGNQPIVGSARGLEPMEGPRRDDGGSFVVLAAAPGAVAFDRLPGDDADPNGVFTRHLLRAMAQPARPLPALMTEVRDAVAGAARAANRTQIPEITDRMVGSGQVMLARGVVPPVPPVVAAPPSPMPQGPAPEALDLAFWQSIQNSRNVADFEAYLARFPNGTFAALARNRIAELRAAQATRPDPGQRAPASPGRAPGYPVAVGQSFRDCPECPEMVVIPPGRFLMGSPPSEAGRFQEEGPQREVVLRAPLAVGKYEVTVAQYRAFAQATGRGDGGSCWVWTGSDWEERPGYGWRNPGFAQGDDHPVVCVSWEDAQAYARWLSQRTGHRYRLLTEAEWEYAARAGTVTRFWWGESEVEQCRHANGFDQTARAQVPGMSDWTFAPCTDGFAYTAPVGRFRPNGFGLHDMAGNMWEWVEDCWRDSYAGAPLDASVAVTTGDCAFRVVRGGSWVGTPRSLRSASRDWSRPGLRLVTRGFRLARAPGG